MYRSNIEHIKYLAYKFVINLWILQRGNEFYNNTDEFSKTIHVLFNVHHLFTNIYHFNPACVNLLRNKYWLLSS